MTINVASRNVQRAEQNQAVDSATKAAVKGFSDSLRLDLFGTGVRVTPLPGPVNTLGTDSSEILLQPDDVADIVGNILAAPGRIERRAVARRGSLNEQSNGPQGPLIACRSWFRLPETNAGGCTC